MRSRIDDPIRPGAGRLPFATLVRAVALVALGLLVLAAATRPGLAAGATPSLRGDVVVSGDVVRFGDLVADAPADAAATPVFHAPALGAIGTIQVARILMTAQALGIEGVATAGREEVTVTRAARRVGQDAIAAALAAQVAEAAGLPAHEIEIAFDGTPPTLLVAPDVAEPVAIADLAYDPATRRFSGAAYIGPHAAERRAQAPVSGVARRVVEVAVLVREIPRGEAVSASDYRIERRPVELTPADARLDALALEERVARRTLTAGAALRQGDLERPMLVSRNDVVLMLYERGALTLTLRGRARQAGARGDVIDVENPVSERILQAEVIGPGTVRVGPAFAGRVAALAQ
ncbi:flagellar basal body P-ring formation chaperone FlgA [Salinarimonas sp.]|uniref:flagellar basal body P-ring formation chaperone FlgA n=1 Tax=Salinarimonas sp. TaxID=2766526 RepID=UPI0032D902BA